MSAYLLPGVFSDPLRGAWDDEGVRRQVARAAVVDLKANAKADHGPKLLVMRLIDWHTRREQPVPARVLAALAVALGIRVRQRHQHRADTARRLRGDGLTALEIARRLGLPDHNPDSAKRQVMRLYKIDGAPSRRWASGADVIAVIPAAAGLKPVDAGLLLYDAARWFSVCGEPLPYDVWWALVVALDLGRGSRPTLVRRGLLYNLGADGADRIRAKTRVKIARKCMALGLTADETARALQGLSVVRDRGAYGLTDATIAALCDGIAKPDGFTAVTKAAGEWQASSRRDGIPPIHALGNIAAAATLDADLRRRWTDRNGEKIDRRKTVEEWTSRPDFERACWSYKILARRRRAATA